MSIQPTRFTTLILVASLVLVYVTSQYLRSSLGVIAPNIAKELALNPQELAMLSSVFFACFALAQIPLGVMIDMMGPKRALLSTSLLAVAGSILFAIATSFEWLVVARALTGIGCSSFFMVPLIIYGNWFSKDKFSTLAGVQLGFGTMGALLASAPLAYLAADIGWRNTFFTSTYILIGILVCVVLFVKDAPAAPTTPKPQQNLWHMIASLPSVTRTRGFWHVFFLNGCGYAIFATFFALWGGPFLAKMHGLELEARGNTLIILAIGQIIGVFCWGPMDKVFGGYKKPVILGSIGLLITLCVFIAYVDMPLFYLKLWFFVFGFFCGYPPLIIGHGKSLFPAESVGRGMTLLNLANIGGVAIMQTIVGAILKAKLDVGYSFAQSFQMGIAAITILFIVALIMYAYAPEPNKDET